MKVTRFTRDVLKARRDMRDKRKRGFQVMPSRPLAYHTIIDEVELSVDRRSVWVKLKEVPSHERFL